MGKLVKLTTEESLELFDRIINVIKKQKKGFFYLKKLKGYCGYCDWDEGITLDYRKDIIPTLIHECIHLLEPEWSEAQVAYSEKRVVNALTEDNVIMLLMFFVKKL